MAYIVSLIQEAPGCLAALQLPARLGYDFSMAASADSIRGGGLCVLTRFPILYREEYALPHDGKGAGALCAVLDLDGRPLRACSIHLDANWSELRAADGQFHLTSMELAQLAWAEFFGQTSRRLAVKALIWQLRGERQMPTLLGGDFNTLPWSSTIRTISRSLRDTAWLTKTYLRGTYHDLSESFQPRIDYLFVSRNVQAWQTQVVSCRTGDHYPVRTELRL
ncbi:hypothetical protein Thiosp_01309 [Thiorhodovibrio litoralis]|nr:hypothetical protein Thiosp_01309 [Thiorhodovibrio litoralis]